MAFRTLMILIFTSLQIENLFTSSIGGYSIRIDHFHKIYSQKRKKKNIKKEVLLKTCEEIIHKGSSKCLWKNGYCKKLCMEFNFFAQNKLKPTHYRMSEQDLIWGTKKVKASIWKNVYQSHMDSAKLETGTNIKFMVKLRWKNSEIIPALWNVCENNAPKEINSLQIYNFL